MSKLNIEHFDLLKKWLINELEKIGNEDTKVLAGLIISLLKLDKKLDDLKNHIIEQLNPMLKDKTRKFINTLFNVLEDNSYVNSIRHYSDNDEKSDDSSSDIRFGFRRCNSDGTNDDISDEDDDDNRRNINGRDGDIDADSSSNSRARSSSNADLDNYDSYKRQKNDDNDYDNNRNNNINNSNNRLDKDNSLDRPMPSRDYKDSYTGRGRGNDRRQQDFYGNVYSGRGGNGQDRGNQYYNQNQSNYGQQLYSSQFADPKMMAGIGYNLPGMMGMQMGMGYGYSGVGLEGMMQWNKSQYPAMVGAVYPGLMNQEKPVSNIAYPSIIPQPKGPPPLHLITPNLNQFVNDTSLIINKENSLSSDAKEYIPQPYDPYTQQSSLQTGKNYQQSNSYKQPYQKRGKQQEASSLSEEEQCTLKCSGIPSYIKEEELKNHFKSFGRVVELQLNDLHSGNTTEVNVTDLPNNSKQYNECLVQFSSAPDAKKCLNSPAAVLNNRFIKVNQSSFNIIPIGDVPEPTQEEQQEEYYRLHPYINSGSGRGDGRGGRGRSDGRGNIRGGGKFGKTYPNTYISVQKEQTYYPPKLTDKINDNESLDEDSTNNNVIDDAKNNSNNILDSKYDEDLNYNDATCTKQNNKKEYIPSGFNENSENSYPVIEKPKRATVTIASQKADLQVKQQYDELQKLREEANLIWKKKEELLQGQIDQYRIMIKKIEGNSNSNLLENLEGKVMDIQAQLKAIKDQRASGIIPQQVEPVYNSNQGGRGGYGGSFSGDRSSGYNSYSGRSSRGGKFPYRGYSGRGGRNFSSGRGEFVSPSKTAESNDITYDE